MSAPNNTFSVLSGVPFYCHHLLHQFGLRQDGSDQSLVGRIGAFSSRYYYFLFESTFSRHHEAIERGLECCQQILFSFQSIGGFPALSGSRFFFALFFNDGFIGDKKFLLSLDDGFRGFFVRFRLVLFFFRPGGRAALKFSCME